MKLPLQAFPGGVTLSTPVNATPYLMDAAGFRDAFARGAVRQRLVEAFDAAALDLHREVLPLFAIVGGSILDLDISEPKDFDAAVFYARHEGRGVDVAGVKACCEAWRDRGLDLRAMPFDGPPAMTAKLIGYFSILYSQRRLPGPTPPVVVVELG